MKIELEQLKVPTITAALCVVLTPYIVLTGCIGCLAYIWFVDRKNKTTVVDVDTDSKE